MGKEFPAVDYHPINKAEYASAIADALRLELRQVPSAIKAVMRWTGANERTVKNWIAGTHGPSGEHLVVLAHHSYAVMTTFHRLASRPESTSDPRFSVLRNRLAEAINIIDQMAD